MDNETQLLDFRIETEQSLLEKKIVLALQEFIDSPYDMNDELGLLDRDQVINEQIELLDRQCRHVGQDVPVYGLVTYAYYDEIEGKDKIEQVFHNGEAVRSEGFTVQRVTKEDGTPGKAIVGHLFRSFQSEREESYSGLIHRSFQYFGFAPYGTIDLEEDKTKEETIDRLGSLIPETMQMIDEIVLNAPNPLYALTSLNKLSYKIKDYPQDVLEQLIHYVNGILEPSTIGPIYSGIQDAFSIDIGPGVQATIPFDTDQYTGGEVQIIGIPKYLHLSQYTSYIDGEQFQSNDMYWALGMDILRGTDGAEKLVGKTIDIMIGNLRDPIPVDIPQVSQ